jgi:hypothetical protein
MACSAWLSFSWLSRMSWSFSRIMRVSSPTLRSASWMTCY